MLFWILLFGCTVAGATKSYGWLAFCGGLLVSLIVDDATDKIVRAVYTARRE